jgi:CarD family transcriptional regulator
MVKTNIFQIGDRVVYPSHGMGEIINIEKQPIAGIEIEVFVISFTKDKMILRIPVKRAAEVGLRQISNKDEIDKIMSILKGKAKVSRGMWSKRAQEYEAKINSGDITAIAEVVRDLYRSSEEDRSYSERMIYESAINRLSTEIAAIEGTEPRKAMERLMFWLQTREAA